MSKILIPHLGWDDTSEGKFQVPKVPTDIAGLLECSDYYLAHSPKQPKKEIADYVESQGIRVPKRFKNQKEAQGSGQKYIARSEHPQDYAGISGLLESFVMQPGEFFDEQSYKQSLLSGQHSRLNEFCTMNEIDTHNFVSELSFSYWEYIEGQNITVVRDEVVPGRYHIFFNYGENGSNYVCYEGEDIRHGNVAESIGGEDIKKLLSQYEKISALSRFDSLQCPNIEFQIGEDTYIYFLQYKRGHQKNLHPWTLDREPEEGEIEADFVRGITKEGGDTFSLQEYEHIIYSHLIPHDISSSISKNLLFNLQLSICICTGLKKMSELNGHSLTSQISQSGLFVAVAYMRLRDSEIFRLFYGINYYKMNPTLIRKIEKNIELKNLLKKLDNLSLDIRIISDGSKSYIKIISPTSIEQMRKDCEKLAEFAEHDKKRMQTIIRK